MSNRRPTQYELEARRNAGTCLAMVGLLAIAAGLFYMVVVVMPDLALAGVVLVALGLFMVLHYVTWGWYLARRRPGDEKYDEPEPDRDPYPPIDRTLDLGDD